jgi:hypothetical protein
VSNERAETYLRLLAEAELRRVSGQLRALDARTAAGLSPEPGMDPFVTQSIAQWKVLRTGRILVAAGALDREFVDRVSADLHVAIRIRSRVMLDWDRKRGMLHPTLLAAPSRPPLPPGPADRVLSVTPIGRTLRVASGRAPSALHFLSLVRTGTEAVFTVVMHMHWPPDGSSTDLEISGAGPHHLPYGQLLAVDDQGTRYSFQFEGDARQMGTWQGIARLSPVPPPGARQLGLTGDGIALIELPLRTPAAYGRRTVQAVTEPAGTPPGERLLMLEAERILASGNVAGPAEGPDPGEIITVLTETGVIPAGTPVPGQLAALCQRLGAALPGVNVPPATELPAQWSSVLAHRDAPGPTDGSEVFAPLASILPDLDGTQFTLTGMSTAAGESHLHMISSGMPQLTDRFAHDWTPGFSWWLHDGTGNWHIGMATAPWSFGDGLQTFWLRWTPPLALVPGPAEVVVTGPSTRARATISIHLPSGGGNQHGYPG